LYVTNTGSNNVSVIDTASNMVIATVAVGSSPVGVSFTPDGARAYVANFNSGNVSVIDTATNTVVATIPAGVSPASFGLFITGPGSLPPGMIPTLSPIGSAVLGLLLAIAAFWLLKRRGRLAPG
jgi:YVTN family beta-propeller protein